jgi:hypothetical protein
MKANIYLNTYTSGVCLEDDHVYKIKVSKKGLKALRKLARAINKNCFNKPTSPTMDVIIKSTKAEK